MLNTLSDPVPVDFKIKVGGVVDRDKFIKEVLDLGYNKVDAVFKAGDTSIRGDVVDVFPIYEKKPIAILHNKKKKFYISSKGDLINFKEIEKYNDLPTVFGNGQNFYSLYIDLQNIEFPLEMIKTFYFFESGRWDLIMKDGKTIKLPIKDYLSSLENFILSKSHSNFKKYKIFDYRIKDQLILN